MNHHTPHSTELHPAADGVQSARLVKTLRRGDIVMFIVAAVISADSIAVLAGNGPEGLVWSAFIGIAFLIPSAFIFAETSSTYPDEGGPYQWARRAFGRTWGSIAVILYWITNPIWLGGSLAFIAGAVFSEYVVHTGAVGDFVVKLVFVWLAILLAIVSLKRGKVLINIGAWVKLIVLLSLSVTAAIHVARYGSDVEWSTATPTAAGFLAIVPVALFAFVGFEAPSAASEEMHDAQKDTPVAIARGAAITMVAYLLPVLAIILVTPADRSADEGVMQAIAQSYQIFGVASGPLLTITGIGFVYALLTQGSAWMMATDRMQAVAAGDGAFFSTKLGEFSEKLGTPVRMNLVSGLVSTAFLLAASFLVHGTAAAVFTVVLTVAVSTLLISYVVIVPAMIKLRLADRDVVRPYRVPGGRRGFVLLALVNLAFIVLGTVAAVVPGVLEGLIGIDYDFVEAWGVTRANFEFFTVGTLVVVIVAALIGRAVGHRSSEEAPITPAQEPAKR